MEIETKKKMYFEKIKRRKRGIFSSLYKNFKRDVYVWLIFEIVKSKNISKNIFATFIFFVALRYAPISKTTIEL